MPNPDLRVVLQGLRNAAMGQQAPDPYHDYAGEQFQRASGTTKGKGFLGEFPITHTEDPGVTSEYSIGDDRAGLDYPTLIPTLNASELNRTLNAVEQHTPLPKSVEEKAWQHAQMRRAQGKNVFAQEGEQNYDIMPYFRRIK